MGYQAVFKRYEIKYMVTAEQKARILKAMEPYMEPDRFGRSTVRNIYFDTDDFVLARHSIAKPDFKEKLRIRSYSKADSDSTVFVELKRKYDGVVYKRRIGLPETDAMKWMAGTMDPVLMREAEAESSQVKREIEYFRNLYRGVKPVLYLSYDREAYRMKKDASALDGGSGFRITFDCNIRTRGDDLDLTHGTYGERRIPEEVAVLEVKTSKDIPYWLVKILGTYGYRNQTFSKYCSHFAPQNVMLSDAASGNIHAAGGNSPAAGNGKTDNNGEIPDNNTVSDKKGEYKYVSRVLDLTY